MNLNAFHPVPGLALLAVLCTPGASPSQIATGVTTSPSFSTSVSLPVEVAKLVDPTGATGTEFGDALALDGEWLAVAAPSSTIFAPVEGAIFLYRRVGSAGPWAFSQALPPPHDVTFAREIDVVLSGTTLAACTVRERVDVYAYDGSAWTVTTSIPSPSNGYLGWDVALEDDVLAVSSGWFDCYSYFLWAEPMVSVYERDAGGPDNWGLVASMSDGAYIGGAFGNRISLDGGILAAAEPAYFYFCGSEAWPLNVYARNLGGPSAWGRLSTIEPPTPNGSSYGVGLQVAGSLLFATDGNGLHVLDRNNGGPNVWDEQALLPGLGSFAAEGTRVYRSVFNNPGTTFEVRERYLGGENAWGLLGELTASDGADIGSVIVVDDGRVATTARNQAAVYVFEPDGNAIGTRLLGPAALPR